MGYVLLQEPYNFFIFVANALVNTWSKNSNKYKIESMKRSTHAWTETKCNSTMIKRVTTRDDPRKQLGKILWSNKVKIGKRFKLRGTWHNSMVQWNSNGTWSKRATSKYDSNE